MCHQRPGFTLDSCRDTQQGKRCGTLIQIHQLFVERQQEILYSHTQLADISSVLGTIDHNYQAELKKANHRLIFAIICVSLLVSALALLTFYVNKQKSYLSNARNELKKTNTQLEELNNKLSSTNGMLKASNDKLNESNGVKEEYIGQFLGACSHYIDKLDKMRLNVNKMVKTNSTTNSTL